MHIYKLFTSQQLIRVNARASARATKPVVYIALASLHYNERVPQPSKKTPKRLAVELLRTEKVKGMGSGAKSQEGGGSCQ
eukprot:6214218-Pleurochrysis_carterae.AAC.1